MRFKYLLHTIIFINTRNNEKMFDIKKNIK